MKSNNIGKIDGREVTTKQLEKYAKELLKLSTRLDLVVKMLSAVSYQNIQGDEFATSFFMKSGQLDTVVDFLQDCQEDVLQVSNEICPD